MSLGEEPKRQLVRLIERHAVFFDAHATWVLLLAGLLALALGWLALKRARSWPP